MAQIMARPRPTALTAFLVGSLGIATFSGMDAVMKGLVIALGIYPTMLWRMLSGVAMSGAYGLTASPALFLGHATPVELVRNGQQVVVGRQSHPITDFN